ncbi:hypothetical protein [Povalibacter sp.]|uniref:arsenate reductase/protein-tyrosine-phosphatase family protein n=1 Tax=Povalibacter sp. TaxID=1962978 RepID=UPI002F40CD3C
MNWSDVAALRMLIVCDANRFHSPLAESLMRREWSGCTISVGSAGISANDGAPANDEALAVARQHGLKGIDDHRTRLLTRQLMRDADLILTMDEQQQHAVRRIMPTYTGRVLLLGGWRGVSIGDPMVTSLRSREWTFGLLRVCVADWKQRMTVRPHSAATAGNVRRSNRVH